MDNSFQIPSNSSVGVIRYHLFEDGSNSIEVLNEQICKIFEFTKEEIEADSMLVFERIGEEHISHVIESINISAKTISPWNDSYNYKTPSGKIKWIEAYGVPYQNDNGNISWHTTIFDNTEEHSLKEYCSELNIRYQVLINTAIDAILAFDDIFNVILFNNAAEKIFGYNSYEVLGAPITKLIPASQNDDILNDLNNFLNDDVDFNSIIKKTIGCKKSGEEFPINISVGKTKHKNKYISVAGIRDISDQEKKEKIINELNENLNQLIDKRTKQLEILLNEKDELLNTLSHNIRSPLTAISTISSLLSANYNSYSEEKSKDLLNTIGLAITQSVDILNNILDKSRLESEIYKLTYDDFNPEKAIKSIFKLNEVKASKKNIKIELGNIPQVKIHANIDKFKGVLDNLLSNAIKFSPFNSTTFLTFEVKDEDFFVGVTDQGPGLKKEDFDNLFKKFTTLSAKPTSTEKSTGLGLYIVKKVMDLMDGKVWCKSEYGNGATFYLSFKLSE